MKGIHNFQGQWHHPALRCICVVLFHFTTGSHSGNSFTPTLCTTLCRLYCFENQTPGCLYFTLQFTKTISSHNSRTLIFCYCNMHILLLKILLQLQYCFVLRSQIRHVNYFPTRKIGLLLGLALPAEQPIFTASLTAVVWRLEQTASEKAPPPPSPPLHLTISGIAIFGRAVFIS
jgi:hypothetical protein